MPVCVVTRGAGGRRRGPTTFQVTLKSLRLAVIFETNDHDSPPGAVLAGVGRLTAVVCREACTEIPGSTDVPLAGMTHAFQQIDVLHRPPLALFRRPCFALAALGLRRTSPVACRLRQATEDGGAEGTRTPDLLIANQPLSQLSYGPTRRVSPIIIGRAGDSRPEAARQKQPQAAGREPQAASHRLQATAKGRTARATSRDGAKGQRKQTATARNRGRPQRHFGTSVLRYYL